ncbi:MAG: transglycosylase SLT domain-containing protein, partial [Thermoanaerobaculia bacterium]
MAPRLTRAAALFFFVLLSAPVSKAATETGPLEREIAESARAGKWNETLALLTTLNQRDAQRYLDGRFDYLTAYALAATGRSEAAIPRFERYIASGDLFDVPARLAAGRLRFARGDALGALELLFPLLQRKESAVGRRAIRIALDALELKLDAAALQRLVAARPTLASRERRRLTALRAEALDVSGARTEAQELRAQILYEARRDDAAAIVLARELRDLKPAALPDRLLGLLTDTARAQRDLELAERLALERDTRAFQRPDPIERWAARFDLARLRAGRGKFKEAEEGFRSVLATRPAIFLAPKKKKDDSSGTAAFFARVRFNLGAILEKLGDQDGAAREFQRVESGRVGPAALATLQRARLETRRGRFDVAEKLLVLSTVAKEPGRIEGALLLLLRRAETGDAAGARRMLNRIELLARARRLPEPWLTELPFWQGRVAEAAGNLEGALAGYADLLAARPYSAAGEFARERMDALDATARTAYLRRSRIVGEELLAHGKAGEAKKKLLPAALLGDAPARDLLKIAYQKLPAYSDILLAPDLPDESLPTLCGDAGACRLIQMGLATEAEPIVRDARRLDTLNGCILAARLAEGADAGPAALEAADALDRRVPDDFLLDLAPRAIVRALAPRPFDAFVAEAARESGVPRDLLYSVMRQESRFDREAASPAAARGLMQLTLPAAGE